MLVEFGRIGLDQQVFRIVDSGVCNNDIKCDVVLLELFRDLL